MTGIDQPEDSAIFALYSIEMEGKEHFREYIGNGAIIIYAIILKGTESIIHT